MIRSNLKNCDFNTNDFSTLINERLDLIGVVETYKDGRAGKIKFAHISPTNGNKESKWQTYSFNDVGRIDIDWQVLIDEIERKLERSYFENGGNLKSEGVMLVGFDTKFKSLAEDSLGELKSLAKSAEKTILGSSVQVRKNIDPRYVIGKGKLRDILLNAKHLGAETLIFDLELSPAQVSAISEETSLTIIDRNQLIFEIFAKHATTKEGQIQIKLAELKYNLPRLRGKGIELSQLGGGIGTRGPGETKLEYQRRAIRKQIENLEKQIEGISKRRKHTRKQRSETGIPTISFVGYTNVGKSTLFNTLTKDSVIVRNKLFSTLTPTTRRIRFPSGTQAVLTDTVGFISRLPKELITAFRATLEELGEATMLVHVADASDPNVDDKIESVESILRSMEFDNIPRITILNKCDKVYSERTNFLENAFNTPLVSAVTKINIKELRNYIENELKSSIKMRRDQLEINYSSTG